jgi:hypothetical protein
VNLCPPRPWLLGLTLTAGAAATQAQFVDPVTWERGSATSPNTYLHWDTFTPQAVAPGENPFVDLTPDLADFNANGQARLTENTGTGFQVGSGNLYTNAAAADYTVTIPEADVFQFPHNTTVMVQLKTLGTELNYDSVKINGLAPVDTAELSRQALGGFGGALVESWFLFHVAYADFADGQPGADDLTLTFKAAGSSMSLDQLRVDTAIQPLGFFAEPNPVPEPASLVLLGIGGAALLNRRPRS